MGKYFNNKLYLLGILIIILEITYFQSTPTAHAAVNYPERVSIASGGSEGNGGSFSVSISADGRYVAFISEASNLVPGDTNETFDVFVRDLQSGITERVSIASNGSQGDQYSFNPSISADGRYVAFISEASNLVPGDTNDSPDVFVRDRANGETERVSISSDGEQGITDFYVGMNMSADGQYVVFASRANNLVSGDTNGASDVFIHNRSNGSTSLVSVALDGTIGNGGSYFPDISDDGNYIVFGSDATNLTHDTILQLSHNDAIFVRDLRLNATELVTVAPDGTPSDGQTRSRDAAISANGRFIAFNTTASNLVPGHTSTGFNLFVHDRLLHTNEVIDKASDGTEADATSDLPDPSISADGRYVTFLSSASNLAPKDTNGKEDIFVHDRITGSTARVNVTLNGLQADEGGQGGIISADGRYITYSSPASNLVTDDTNNFFDSFITLNPFLQPNYAPILFPIGNKTVLEGELLQFTASAIDPDGNNLTYSAANLPAGAVFDPQTHTFSWIPDYGQSGNYSIDFTVIDDGSPVELDLESITITVGNTNRAPVISPLGSQEVLENQLLTFTVNASDPDGDTVTLSASDLPTNATFDLQNGVFSWTPTNTQSGNYIITFAAADNGTPAETGTTQVSVTVGDVPSPVEQADNLVNIVTIASDLPENIENSYLSNLKKIKIFIEEGKIQPAINQLNSFIQKVEKDFQHGDITQAQKDQFLALANDLLADLR